MKQTLVTCLIGLILFSCQTSKEDLQEGNDSNATQGQSFIVQDTGKEAYNIKAVNFDTLISVGNEIVFFKPTQEEFESLIEAHGEESGLYEVESDFSYYANAVADSLKNSNTKVSLATQRIIKIVAFDKTVSYLDRLENGTNEYGFILNSSKHEPRVEFGVFTDVGILETVKE